MVNRYVSLVITNAFLGLTAEERDLIADAYDKGLIKTICCTPTMAAGVNLPGKFIMIRIIASGANMGL